MTAFRSLGDRKTFFSTYPLGDSVDLRIAHPSVHRLETPVARRENEKVGVRDVSESTVQTTDAGKTNSSS